MGSFLSPNPATWTRRTVQKRPESEREIRLLPELGDVLKAAKPFHVGVDEHVFKKYEGQLPNFHTWSAKDWLRSCGIRKRKPYSIRYSYPWD